jgi:hypothetical protein
MQCKFGLSILIRYPRAVESTERFQGGKKARERERTTCKVRLPFGMDASSDAAGKGGKKVTYERFAFNGENEVVV